MVKNRLQCRRPGFDPWVEKIPWRREWQPTPLFLPGESHGQKSLAGYSSRGHKKQDTTERLTKKRESERKSQLLVLETEVKNLRKGALRLRAKGLLECKSRISNLVMIHISKVNIRVHVLSRQKYRNLTELSVKCCHQGKNYSSSERNDCSGS